MTLQPFRHLGRNGKAVGRLHLADGFIQRGFKATYGKLPFLRIAYGHEPVVGRHENEAVQLERATCRNGLQKTPGMLGNNDCGHGRLLGHACDEYAISPFAGKAAPRNAAAIHYCFAAPFARPPSASWHGAGRIPPFPGAARLSPRSAPLFVPRTQEAKQFCTLSNLLSNLPFSCVSLHCSGTARPALSGAALLISGKKRGSHV